MGLQKPWSHTWCCFLSHNSQGWLSIAALFIWTFCCRCLQFPKGTAQFTAHHSKTSHSLPSSSPQQHWTVHTVKEASRGLVSTWSATTQAEEFEHLVHYLQWWDIAAALSLCFSFLPLPSPSWIQNCSVRLSYTSHFQPLQEIHSPSLFPVFFQTHGYHSSKPEDKAVYGHVHACMRKTTCISITCMESLIHINRSSGDLNWPVSASVRIPIQGFGSTGLTCLCVSVLPWTQHWTASRNPCGTLFSFGSRSYKCRFLPQHIGRLLNTCQSV